MFLIDCKNCDKRQLLSMGRLRRLINGDRGILVILECWCGAVGAYRTGRARGALASPTNGTARALALLRQK